LTQRDGLAGMPSYMAAAERLGGVR
jgi:hypothetical protein